LEGWEQSVGARNEMTMAAMLGVPICTFPGHDPIEWEAHFSNAPTPQVFTVRLDDVDDLHEYTMGFGDKLQRALDEVRAIRSPTVEEIQQWAAEVRVTDPETGGEKGTKLARFDLIPAGPLLQLAEHYGIGARKYADRNWERGYAWSLSFAALQRHAWAFWNGEDNDPETQSHHMAAVAFHAFALMQFGDTDTGTDDRP
jgi:hypothetical protein